MPDSWINRLLTEVTQFGAAFGVWRAKPRHYLTSIQMEQLTNSLADNNSWQERGNGYFQGFAASLSAADDRLELTLIRQYLREFLQNAEVLSAEQSADQIRNKNGGVAVTLNDDQLHLLKLYLDRQRRYPGAGR